MTVTQERTRFFRRYAYGFMQYLLDVICTFPSQHVRRWFLTGLYGLRIGRESVIYRKCELRAPWKIQIGSGASVGGGVVLDGRGGIQIGDNVNVSSGVMLWTAQHDYRDSAFAGRLGAITLEKYVWLGPRVIVLPGITVREGCVVAAGAVVTEDTEPYGIYAGLPARRIGDRTRDLDYTPGRNYTPFV